MFDNTFVYLQTILDSKKEPVQDNVGDPLQSREYNGLLAKFLEGIPDSFQVDSWLRDNHNGNKGRYVLLDSERDDVKDSNDQKFNTRGYSTEQILDSGNNPIRSLAVFVKN